MDPRVNPPADFPKPPPPPSAPPPTVFSSAAKAIRQAALKEAAEHLRGVASDYKQMARQTRHDAPPPGSLGRTEAIYKAQTFEEKANLLEAQARQIEAL